MENSNSNAGIKIIVTILIVGAIVYGAWQFSGRSNQGSSNPSENIPPAAPEPSSMPPTGMMDGGMMMNKKYKDGTYTASGGYNTPGVFEEITLTLVVKNGIVTDASFQGNPGTGTARRMQNKFNAGYKDYVIGKSIDSISLTVVNGASLTPIGFMEALDKIKAQAKA